jgi:hypothetical protein
MPVHAGMQADALCRSGIRDGRLEHL